MKAIWNNATIAQSDDTTVVEGNHYFPPDSVHQEFLESSDTETSCPWKGRAGYYHVIVNGETNPDAAWYYPHPKEAAAELRNRVAFWRGIQIVEG